MSNVQLQVRPRRVRCAASCEPPPFRFSAAASPSASSEQAAARRVLLAPFKAIWLALAAIGRLIDAAFFLVVLTVWCALHLTVWSYAFEIGPAADCFGLPCPTWLDGKVVVAAVALAATSYLLARFFRRLGHRFTSMMLLLLVTFDVAALLLLGINAVL